MNTFISNDLRIVLWTIYRSSTLEEFRILPLGVDKYTFKKQGLVLLDSNFDVKFSCANNIRAVQLFITKMICSVTYSSFQLSWSISN